MSTAKILIVEDEVLIAEHIKDYLLSFGLNQIYLAHNKKLALNAIEDIKPDLILLDMHLQHPLDGIELANTIDETTQIPYIFITANSDMLIIQEAIKTKAAAYITKPLKKSDLFAAVQIALKLHTLPAENHLLIKEGNSNFRVVINDIFYIESMGNYINIFTKQQKLVTRQSLEWIQEKLPEHQFMRVHRSYIINVKFANRTTSKSVFILETEIPVSRTYMPKLSGFVKGH